MRLSDAVVMLIDLMVEERVRRECKHVALDFVAAWLCEDTCERGCREASCVSCEQGVLGGVPVVG